MILQEFLHYLIYLHQGSKIVIDESRFYSDTEKQYWVFGLINIEDESNFILLAVPDRLKIP